MNKRPTSIWVQWKDDEIGMTWCEDKVNESDLGPFILDQELDGRLKDLRAENLSLKQLILVLQDKVRILSGSRSAPNSEPPYWSA